MTVEENKKPDLDLDITPLGLQRLQSSFLDKGKLDLSEFRVKLSDKAGQQFSKFISESLEGITTREEALSLVELDLDLETANGDEILKQAWNKRAKAWGLVESPANYFATMSTLVYYFETSKKKQEKVLSLGSGPGLYEMFLVDFLSGLSGTPELEMYCLDFSPEMTRVNRLILQKLKRSKNSMNKVIPVTGNMTKLKYTDQSIDQIICNNSLQWVPNWQTAISEMARVLKPNGPGFIYLFINRNPMRLIDISTKTELLKVGDIKVDELFDVLEKNKFEIQNTRQWKTQKGFGQRGGTSDRMFIKARLIKDRKLVSWKDMSTKASVSGIYSK